MNPDEKQVADLVTAVREVLNYRITKDVKDGWHYQRQVAFYKLEQAVRPFITDAPEDPSEFAGPRTTLKRRKEER